MNQEPEEIEVEVVDVVDQPLSRRSDATEEMPGPRGVPPESGWRTQWQGRVKKLDMRWWPLWSVLALLALIPLILLALIVGIFLVILKSLGSLLSLGKQK